MPDGTQMRIEPGAAERIAQAFDRHADNLAAVSRRLERAGHSTGFAGFPSADELHAGFTNKARLAIGHLQEQIDLTRRHAAEIRAAGAAYIETDSTNSTMIGEAGSAVSPDTGSG
ncbi:hypothetical protein [Millisia brevis]|uniref:hypothetical protein n=1 Tax=Millisia brevis TaxID=264148 RepID=UPI0008343A02|nr:hypothetical protein [Millisia brevis]